MDVRGICLESLAEGCFAEDLCIFVRSEYSIKVTGI